MRVYVVGFAPADERGATGGFDWFPTPEAAAACAKRSLFQLAELGTHSVTFVPLDVPDSVAYPNGESAVQRDEVTSWIDANLHLVEVGLDPTPDSNDGGDAPPRCMCASAVLIPGRANEIFPWSSAGSPQTICAGHRETLSANTLRGVSMADPPEEPRQTRPSAIVRRPDPETPISESTVAELLTEALERAKARRGDRRGAASGREFSIVVTLLEDAITRHNKGVYMERGVFAITDAERIPE